MFKKLVRVFANAFNNNSSRNNAATSSRPQPPAYKPSYLQQLETPALSTGLIFGKSLEDLERDEQNVPIVMNAFIKFAEMKKGKFHSFHLLRFLRFLLLLTASLCPKPWI